MNRATQAVEQCITVALSRADAFELFTRGLARWWPFKGHSCSEDPQDVVFEGRVGGAVTEIGADGSRHAWGTLTAWDPPAAFAMTWHPGQASARATRLAIRFTAVAAGCEVHLVHEGWDVLGEAANDMRGNYERGWGWVLGHYVEASVNEVAR